MNDQERGLLFVEREKLEKQVEQMNKELVQHGILLNQFGQKLQERPESMTFSNAPQGLGSYPLEYMREESFNWDDFPSIDSIAQKIQNYRTIIGQLSDVKRRLK